MAPNALSTSVVSEGVPMKRELKVCPTLSIRFMAAVSEGVPMKRELKVYLLITSGDT